MATASDDVHLGRGPSEDYEDSVGPGDDSDSGSVLSDDSVLPDYEREDDESRGGPAGTLYEACARNDTRTLQRFLEEGVTREQAMEVDINGRNGLMVAVASGYVDIVYALHVCPLIDINHQDADGNTALMIAAQAGFATVLNYIMNYYAGTDMEVRDPRGFTALIKAGLQGRQDCVAALLMHGADINALDLSRGRGLKDWVLKTGRFETLTRLRRLQALPVAGQFCESYVPEWPDLRLLVAKATASKTTGQKLSQKIKDTFTITFPQDPQDNGVMDHLVRITTGLHSPLVATGCRPLCPSSPPEMGKRRLAVPELLARHGSKGLEEGSVCHSNGSATSAATPRSSPSLMSCCQERGKSPGRSRGLKSFMSHSLMRHNAIFPSGGIPKIEVTRSREPTPKKQKKKRKMQSGYLEPPIWKYKEAKEEKKKEIKKKEQEQEEQEKKIQERKRKSKKKMSS